MIDYTNEINMEIFLMVVVGFHVAKQGDGRRVGQIRIVYGMNVLAKFQIPGVRHYLYL